MSDIDITLHTDLISAALSDWPEGTITGGQLNKLIHDAAPKLNIRAAVGMLKGPGALSVFVLRHLPEHLERVGYQGKDAVFCIRGREASKLPNSASSQVWRTFVSPNSGKHLVLERSVPLLVPRDAPAVDMDAEVEIAKAQPDEHDSIRRAFADSLATAEAATLQQGGAADADFTTWITTLRREFPSSVRDWGQFRRGQLAKLFRSRITVLGLDPALQSVVLDQVADAERAAYAKETSAAVEAVKLPRSGWALAGAEDALVRARRLAHAAVDVMTLDELRATKLPLGVVLDADRG